MFSMWSPLSAIPLLLPWWDDAPWVKLRMPTLIAWSSDFGPLSLAGSLKDIGMVFIILLDCNTVSQFCFSQELELPNRSFGREEAGGWRWISMNISRERKLNWKCCEAPRIL